MNFLMRINVIVQMMCLVVVAHAGELAAKPSADVVSIDGAITEIVYALGASERLLAVDTTSRFPAQAQDLPQVGYMRQLSAEGILSLRPTLVLASKDAGPETVFEQLTAAGIRIVRIEAADSLNGVISKVEQVAQALDRNAEGQALVADIRARTQAAIARIPQVESPKTLFLLGASGRGVMAAGAHTKAQALLDMLSIKNVFTHDGYKPISAEGAVQAAPDIVLVGHTGPADTSALEQTLAMTPASQNGRIYAIDVGLALGFGPRLADALEAISLLIYPPNIAAE